MLDIGKSQNAEEKEYMTVEEVVYRRLSMAYNHLCFFHRYGGASNEVELTPEMRIMLDGLSRELRVAMNSLAPSSFDPSDKVRNAISSSTPVKH